MQRNWWVVALVAGFALAGCKRAQDEGQKQAEDIAAAAEEAKEEVVEAGEEAQEEIAQAGEAVDEQMSEVAGDEEPPAEGSGGMVSGTLGSTLGTQITITDARGNEFTLGTDDSTQVVYQGRSVEIDDYEEGTEVRASYEVKGDDRIAREVVILEPKE